MTVYVESNFVLEIALGQQQSAAAETILELAERGECVLAVPSFSLGEPFSTVAQHGQRRRNVANGLKEIVRDLGRSKIHQEDVTFIEQVPDELLKVGDRQIKRLMETAERITTIAVVIDSDASVYHRAVDLKRRYRLDMPDAIATASIFGHLEHHAVGEPHYFVTRDAADFSPADIRGELERFGCTLIPTFHECVQRLQHSV